MEQGQTSDLNKRLYEAIRQAIPADLKILFISLTGSRGKNLASAESDYDVRVITVSPYEKYLLQKPTQTFKLDTIFEGQSLEGQTVDFLKSFDYAINTNPFIIDTLRGIPVYSASDAFITQLRETFIKSYMPLVPMNAFRGILYHYIKKELRNKEGNLLPKVPAKAIVECIFIVLEIRCLFSDKYIIDYFDIDKLLEFAGEDAEFMKNLVEIRRKDRKLEIPVPAELDKIVETELERSSKYQETFSSEQKAEVEANRQVAREETDRFCLEFLPKFTQDMKQ